MVAVGAVGTRSARLWVHARDAERLEVEIRPATALPSEIPVRAVLGFGTRPESDHTRAFDIPDDVPGLDRLEPDRVYTFRVCRAGGPLVGEGRFRTACEDPPKRFSFGIASCHQPFDDHGNLVPSSLKMLDGATRALDEHDARFMLQVGDQIYADHPPGRSLFGDYFAKVAPPGRRSILECTREEVRALYQQRHREYFAVPSFRELISKFPCYPMLDDHEIRDNFGSAPEHSTKEWAALRAGAREAFHDYQSSRVLDGPMRSSFHYGFVNGPVGVYVLDLRSQRHADEKELQILGEEQMNGLARFLREHGDLPAIAIVVTVPVFYLQSWVVGAVTKVLGEDHDAGDRWSNPKSLRDRDRLIAVIRGHQREHPEQQVMLLGGDIHVGSLFRLDWNDGGPPLVQFTASPLSNAQGKLMTWASEIVPKALAHVKCADGLEAHVTLVPGVNGGRNPYGGLHLGIVEIEMDEGRARVRFKLIGTPAEDGSTRVVYESPLL